MLAVLERLFHDKIATEDLCLTGSERFRGKLAGACPAHLVRACAAACPVGAFCASKDNAEGYTIDYSRCLFCGRCTDVLTQHAGADVGVGAGIDVGADALLHHTKDDAMPFYADSAQEIPADIVRQKLGRSLHVRHLDAGSCNACDFEMGALANPIYDLHRYGVHFEASPRHADLLMVTGVVTRNLAEAVRMTYDAMPEPRLVMACGACAAGGATFGASYAVLGKLSDVIPVDLVVPGCPPRPAAMIAALLAAADMLQARL